MAIKQTIVHELLQKNQSARTRKPSDWRKKFAMHEIKIRSDNCDERITKMMAGAAHLENATLFSQWDTGLFVDNETTDEKHALSTRCYLPQKEYMFPGVIQCKTKRYFRREYLGMYRPITRD